MISKPPGAGTDRLHHDVTRKISLFLNNKDFCNLSSVNKAWRQESIGETKIRQLLEYVMNGEETKAEALIEENPAILRQKCTGTDPAGRTFENITAFQYALRALDWYMWEMMQKEFVDKSKARNQYEGLVEHGTTDHGNKFDLKPLIDALITYKNEFELWSRHDCKRHWGDVVGEAQRQLPMHVVQEYCRTDRSFDPCPNFEGGARGRDFKVCILDGRSWRIRTFEPKHWFPTEGRHELGWGPGRVESGAQQNPAPRGADFESKEKADLHCAVIKKLSTVREQQFIALGVKLSQAVVPNTISP